MKEQCNILVSGDVKSEILKHITQPSDEQKKKLFEVLGDYKIEISTPAEQVLKLIFRFALTHFRSTYNKELRPGLQHFISKAFPSSTIANVEDFVENLGIQIMGGADVVTEAKWTPVICKGVINITL